MKVTHFILDRPSHANALDLATAQSLEKTILKAIKEKATGLIISSANPKIFCSGGDLKSYRKMKSKTEGLKPNSQIGKILSKLRVAPFLTVAALEGDALGGGCELALACDFIFSSPQVRFAFRQGSLGLVTGWGGGKNLLVRVKPSTALDWLCSGRWISAQEALKAGLVDRIFPTGGVSEESEKFLEGMSSDMIGDMKKLVYSGGKDEGRIFNRLWWGQVHRRRLGE